VAEELLQRFFAEVLGGKGVFAAVLDVFAGDLAVLDLALGVGHVEGIASGFEGVAAVGEREGERAEVEELALPAKALVRLRLAVAGDLLNLVDLVWSAEPFQCAF
jgi:hypothetical protein